MLEWMFFVFIILHTESAKIKIMEESQLQDQVLLQKLMQDIKQNPQKLTEFIELKKK